MRTFHLNAPAGHSESNIETSQPATLTEDNLQKAVEDKTDVPSGHKSPGKKPDENETVDRAMLKSSD